MRITTHIDSVKRFLIVGLPVGVALVLFVLNYYGLQFDGLAAIFLYALLCELYLFCFTLVLSSVSVLLLISLREKNIEIFNLYKDSYSKEMVKIRINNLIKNSYLNKKENIILITRKGINLHNNFSKISFFFNHRKSN